MFNEKNTYLRTVLIKKQALWPAYQLVVKQCDLKTSL